jgi:hypothetical protein
MNRAVRTGVTLAMVCFAWIFFRANTVGDAFAVIGKMFLIDLGDFGISVVGLPSFLRSVLLVLVLFAVDMTERRVGIQDVVARLPMAARWSIYTAAVWAVAVSGVFGVRQEFIYFQF